jgi:hypothetical protein
VKSEVEQNRKGPSFFGPGTVIAFVAAIAILASGRLDHRPAVDSSAVRIVYEADKGGRLRPVDTPTAAAATTSPLWKPEVALLLMHASALRLDSRQKEALAALNAGWLSEKASLEAALRTAVSDANVNQQAAQTHHSASAGAITASLGDYSQFSRQYNDRRAFYWSQAAAALRPEQTAALEQITTTDRKGNRL